MNKEETQLVLTCNIMRGTGKIMSCAFTEWWLLLTFKLEREPMPSKVRYDAAQSSVTCIGYPGNCKVQISSAPLPTILHTLLQGLLFRRFPPASSQVKQR